MLASSSRDGGALSVVMTHKSVYFSVALTRSYSFMRFPRDDADIEESWSLPVRPPRSRRPG